MNKEILVFSIFTAIWSVIASIAFTAVITTNGFVQLAMVLTPLLVLLYLSNHFYSKSFFERAAKLIIPCVFMLVISDVSMALLGTTDWTLAERLNILFGNLSMSILTMLTVACVLPFLKGNVTFR